MPADDTSLRFALQLAGMRDGLAAEVANRIQAQAAITGGSINNTNIGATTAGTGRFSTLIATGAVTFTSGTINGVSVGATTRSTGAFTSLAVTRTDSSGTPGNVTNNSALGRAAIAAAASTCVVTNSLVTATSEVFVNLITTDATLTSIRVTSVGAGTFTVTGNAAATAAATFSFFVVN